MPEKKQETPAIGRFDYNNAVTPAQQESVGRVRDGFKALEVVLEELPPSRLLSVAFTQLEMASAMAIKAITHEAPKKAE